ncbi:MAG: RNA polymerase sigma factor [Pseudomonadota bacterium]
MKAGVLKLVPNVALDAPGPGPRPDDELMLLCSAGDAQALAQLMRRHERAVRRFLGRMVGLAEARDLCQETFFELWRTRGKYRAQGRFTVLLYRIARNKAYNHLRWRKVRTLFARRTGDHAPLGPAVGQGALDSVLRQEREIILHRVLSGLPPRLREAVLLHHAEGLDFPTISRITGVPEGTLRARCHRGLVLLRERLTRREEP